MRSLLPARDPLRNALFSALVIGCALNRTCHAAEEPDRWDRVRLRIQLQTEQPSAWRGEVALTAGRLERLQPLWPNPVLAAGAVESDGVVRLEHRRAVALDAFDVTAHCPRDALLVCRVDGAEVTIAIDHARREPQKPAAERGFTVTATRVASDRLRVATERDSLIFDPSEEFEFDVLAEPSGVERGRPFDLVATLSKGRDGAEVWRSVPIRLETPAQGPTRTSFAVPMPAQEGVYRVTLAASTPSGFFSRFTRRLPPTKPTPPLALRSFQVVVFDSKTPPPKLGAWRETYTFDPRSHHWADRLPKWMKWKALPWFARGPVSSDHRTDLQAEVEGAIEIPAAIEGGAHWRAYPLPVDEVGAAYAVEVEALGEPDSRLTIAVLEPDALGDLRPLGNAVSHVAPRWNRATGRQPVRMLVQPRTASPLLLVANPSPNRPARFGRIRLLKSGGSPRGPVAKERMVALDWPSADLPRAVGASHTPAPGGFKEEIADLQSWLETARRLADRVEAAGANAAVVDVNGRGGAIYPSRAWPTTWYDLTARYEGYADLPRREGLRLITREFERRGLRIVPAIRFDTATPWRSGPSDDGGHLRSRVAAELLDAIGPSNALAGVAVRVSPGGWELLSPGQSTAEAEVLVADYARLQVGVGMRVSSKTPVLLLPAGLASQPSAARLLAPRLGGAGVPVEEVLAASGLRALIDAGASPPIATPRGGAPVGSPIEGGNLRASLESLGGALGAKRPTLSLRSGRQPVRLFDSARRLRIEGNDRGDVVLPATIVAAGAEESLLAEAIQSPAGIVVLGGEGPSGWLDDSVAAQRRLVAATPAPETTNADGAPTTAGDVVANAYAARDDASFVVVTNHSPWPRPTRLTIEIPTRMRGALIGPDGGSPEWFESGWHPEQFTLAPHETRIWRFDGPGVAVGGVRVPPAPEAQRELAEGIADLRARDTTQRRPIRLLANASFEEEDDTGGPLGWIAGPGVTRGTSFAFEGAASARMVATPEAPARLTSAPFLTTETGQLVLELRLRVEQIDPAAEFRIELEQVEGSYRRDTRLSGEQLLAAAATGWLPPVLFPNDDLPLAPGARLRFRMTLAGDGELLLDDLQTEDLVLPLDGMASIELLGERLALVRMMNTAESLLAEGRLEACRELLDSYWARFLMAHFPPHQASPEDSGEPSVEETAADEPNGEDATPSLGQRMRDYLVPRWWR